MSQPMPSQLKACAGATGMEEYLPPAVAGVSRVQLANPLVDSFLTRLCKVDLVRDCVTFILMLTSLSGPVH